MVLTIDKMLLNFKKSTDLSYNELLNKLYCIQKILQSVLTIRFLNVKQNKKMIKVFQKWQMIFLKNSTRYLSIINTDYRVLGLWSQTHKQLANIIVQKTTWKEIIVLFSIKLIVDAIYREGRNKIDKMCSFKIRSTTIQWTHI